MPSTYKYEFCLRTVAKNDAGDSRHAYLHAVGHGGLTATFHLNFERAMVFSAKERRDFIENNPHIKGFWVNAHAERQRINKRNKS